VFNATCCALLVQINKRHDTNSCFTVIAPKALWWKR